MTTPDDGGHQGHEAELTEQVDRLQADILEQHRQLEHLEDDRPSLRARQATEEKGSSTSRRDLLRRAGLASAAAAGGLVFLDREGVAARKGAPHTPASPAVGGTQGTALIMGDLNTSTATTVVEGAGATFSPVFKVDSTGTNATATALLANALAGDIGIETSGPGTDAYLAGSGVLSQAPVALGTNGLPTRFINRKDLVRSIDGGLFAGGRGEGWRRVNSVIPLTTPARVIYSVSGVGGISGLLSPGNIYTSHDLRAGSIPKGAIGVVGNLTMIAQSLSHLLNGLGYMSIWPGGTAWPGTSNINPANGCYATANSVTVSFGTAANAGKVAIKIDGGGVEACHVILDVFAYLM